MPIKAVLFDIDGTLVDSNAFHIAAWQEAFATIGKAFDADTIHDQIGKGADMPVPTLLPDIDEDAQDKLGKVHGEVFKAKFLARVEPFADARAILARVQAEGLRAVLASSASKAELDHYVDLLDARQLISETTSADDVARTKPAPDIFATALAKVAPLGPDEVLVVGDTPYDIEAACRCGIAAIGVRSGGFADDALIDAGAVALYDDVAHLLRDYAQSPLAR